MSIFDIKSREAVLKAIEKFDAIGREAFLKEYGFGRAKSYLLFHNGNYYDSKAILGVAHEFEFSEALRPNQFNGGEETVKRQLEKLGFSVVKDTEPSETELKLFSEYSRRDVHGIFSPQTTFTPQSGTWGLQGIISIPNRPSDFVFFVTFGQSQGNHAFDEGITQEGILFWQSQPRQSLKDGQIQKFIDHDELENTIYLFLRTEGRQKYTYLGPLGYVSHDSDRERPVFFQWQLLEAPIPTDVLERMNLKPHVITGDASQTVVLKSNELVQVDPPTPTLRTGKTTDAFRKPSKIDFPAIDERNREIGKLGEKLVLQHEIDYLRDNGRPDLASQVRHIAETEGDGAGYDILSFTLKGEEKYIEVKTTTRSQESPFFISSHELSFYNANKGKVYIYRVFSFSKENNAGKFYVIHDDLEARYDLTPTAYRVSLKSL